MMSFVQTCMYMHATKKHPIKDHFCRCTISYSGVHVALVFQFVLQQPSDSISNSWNKQFQQSLPHIPYCMHVCQCYSSCQQWLQKLNYITNHFSSILVGHLLSRVYTPFCQIIIPPLLYFWPARAPTDSQPACTTEPTSAWPTQKLKVNIVPWR